MRRFVTTAPSMTALLKFCPQYCTVCHAKNCTAWYNKRNFVSCRCAALRAPGCLPEKHTDGRELASWPTISNIDEEVERDDTTFCKRSARSYPFGGGFRNCRAGFGAVGVGIRVRCLLGHHCTKSTSAP